MLKGIVSGVPTDITRIAMKGKNLFDKTTATIDYRVTLSGLAYSEGMACSDYIDVDGLSYITVSSKPDATNIYFYSSKTVESDSYFNGLSAPVPAGAKYARVNFAKTNLNTFMLNAGSTALPYEPYGMQPGWEVRDQQGTILWGADKTLTGTDSISFKGYGLPLKSYEIEANMEQAASQQYSISGTDSVTYQSDGTSIALQIVGNETQTGTPTPTVPITPEECGDMTDNLFDITATDPNNGYETGVYLRTNGATYTPSASTNARISEYIAVDENTQYSQSNFYIGTSRTPAMCFYDSEKNYLDGIIILDNPAFTTPANTAFIRISYTATNTDTMLNTGSTALPYEPFGYKIPITNGNTTYNVYLTEPLRKISDYGDTAASDGTVVRRIKKLVLDGTEDWVGNSKKDTEEIYQVYNNLVSYPGTLIPTNVICSHLETKVAASVTSIAQGITMRGSASGIICGFSYDTIGVTAADSYSTATNKVKSYLSTQYQNGTPVTVWYVLATPVSDTATFPTITPTQGSNTLSVNTTLSPSAITLTATSGVWPKNPITPEEFGESTENLFDISTAQHNKQYDNNGNVANSTESGDWYATDKIPVDSSKTYIRSVNESSVGNYIYEFDANKEFIAKCSPGYGVPFQVSASCKYIGFNINNDSTPIDSYMFNSGSTPLPYEPYGKYKIPITNAGTTYNIFLTEPLRKIGDYADSVSSDGTVTRRIKKRILTGQENGWEPVSQGDDTNYFRLVIGAYNAFVSYQCLCTHYMQNTISLSTTDVGVNVFNSPVLYSFVLAIRPNNSANMSLADFKSMLATQYSAGHPVEVWYVLATAQTETVTAPEIATTAGTNTLTVDTTLAPSQTTITGHIKYST